MPKHARRGQRYTVRVNKDGSQQYKRVPACGWIVYLPLAIGISLASIKAAQHIL